MGFSYILKNFIGNDETRKRNLADELRVAPAFIDRWILGISAPHSAIQKVIIEYIEQKQKTQ